MSSLFNLVKKLTYFIKDKIKNFVWSGLKNSFLTLLTKLKILSDQALKIHF